MEIKIKFLLEDGQKTDFIDVLKYFDYRTYLLDKYGCANIDRILDIKSDLPLSNEMQDNELDSYLSTIRSSELRRQYKDCFYEYIYSIIQLKIMYPEQYDFVPVTSFLELGKFVDDEYLADDIYDEHELKNRQLYIDEDGIDKYYISFGEDIYAAFGIKSKYGFFLER